MPAAAAASRLLSRATPTPTRTGLRPLARIQQSRALSQTLPSRRAADATPASMAEQAGAAAAQQQQPVRKPIGGLRGGIFGFLAGSLMTGSFLYFYTFDDVRKANHRLAHDILVRSARDSKRLAPATQSLNQYVLEVESMVSRLETKQQKK
ncbi:hypothetical protein KEM52_001335 [Ascosphaera acerosa]|nr:hypothetical protein KEM52_001335 [Ascosphaera acerosa]